MAYLFAVAGLLGTLGLSYALHPWVGEQSPLTLFMLAAMAATWLGGWGPGLTTMLAGGLIGDFFFVSPLYTLGPTTWAAWSVLLIYVLVTSCSVALIEALYRAHASMNSAVHSAHTCEEQSRDCMGQLKPSGKRAQASDCASNQRFRLLADAAPAMIWTSGPDLLDTWFNRRWLNFTGRESAEAIEAAWTSDLHEGDRTRVALTYTSAFDRREPFETEYRLRRADGDYRWVQSQGAPFFDEHDSFLGFVGICTDVTERKLAEEKLLQFNAELEQRVRERTAELEAANRELEAFSYSVSHDLRAPLRSVSGFSKAVLEEYQDQLAPQGVAYLRYACEASQRMSRLIEDLIALSRFTRCELRRQEVNLSALAQGILAELQQSEPNRPVEAEITPQLKARGDEGLLRIALQNLLNNAWKFTGKQLRPRIELGATQLNGDRLYFVRDNGAGFNMNHADRLFGVFQRLHSMEDFPGTGIGLATVRRILHRHGGEIWAEGSVNKGATFYFTLPNNT